MARRLPRVLLALAVVLIAGYALFLAFRPRPVLVEVAQIARGRFEAVVEEDGRTRVRDRYVVSAPVAGRVLRLGARPGDLVRRDETVAAILSAPSALLGPRARREAEERVGAAEALLQEAGLLVERAAAQQAQAAADASRARTLFAQGATPAQQLERAELAERTAMRDMQAAERRRHAAEHELGQARAVLQFANTPEAAPERHEVRAPIDGRVLRRLQDSEAVVAAGAPLLELGDASDLEVVVDVLTTEAVGIHPGTTVAIERWGGPAPLAGRVRLVEPGAFTKVSALGVEEQRVGVVIDIVSPREQWAGLGDGFRVDARIVTAAVEDAVLVPASALFRRGSGWAVFVVQDGRAHEQNVQAAQRAARNAMVSAGLTGGETVVLFPPSTLRDGARVAQATPTPP